MIDKRPEADRILVARLSGTAKRHCLWRELSAEEEAVAVAELRELAAGRADLPDARPSAEALALWQQRNDPARRR